MSKSIPMLLRDIEARNTALRTYAQSHDRFSDAEQLYVAEGQHVMAEGAHTYALIALRAWLAERDDPEPHS